LFAVLAILEIGFCFGVERLEMGDFGLGLGLLVSYVCVLGFVLGYGVRSGGQGGESRLRGVSLRVSGGFVWSCWVHHVCRWWEWLWFEEGDGK